jgi:fructose-specific component phosphotransferase system IIB-like protein
MKILLLIQDPLEARTTTHLLNELGHEATAAPSIELGMSYVQWCDEVWMEAVQGTAAWEAELLIGKRVVTLQDPNDTILDPGLTLMNKPVYVKGLRGWDAQLG